VPADVYRVTVDDAGQVQRGNIDARSGPVVLRPGDLRPVPIESAERRGGGPDEATPSRASVLSVVSDPSYRVMPVNIGILPSLSTNALEHRRTVINYLSLSLFIGLTPRLIGLDIALAVSRIVEAIFTARSYRRSAWPSPTSRACRPAWPWATSAAICAARSYRER
jgi:hypothetical protein